ncbi:Uncharacterised protein [Mycolicibacterium smegmatis]|nr:Uncharacterised protein [Mycolicibacterium smegmatis]
MKISKVWKVAELIDWVTRNISLTPMTLSTEVVFIRPLNEFPMGGTMTRSACGTMIHRITLTGFIPSDAAASNCPFGTESSPARMISAM